MSIERRSVLKGMALGGLAGLTLGRAGSASAAPVAGSPAGKPLLMLVSGAEAEAAFMAGVRANPAGQSAILLRTDSGMEFLSALQQRLHGARNERIIGLVDDASGALILSLARSAGARLHWSGQHVSEGGQSRHRLSVTSDAGACIGQFAALSEECDRPSALSEQILAAGPQWAPALAFALTSPEPGRRYLRAAPPTRAAVPNGHYVSFSIEI
ncbi:hypothetical protein [Oceanimonas baumannii]|uniref:Twin-arginine translocation pathway signal n=1 Tax=Oceanimonas baumannii TaxID=129578 RepID=A0A235CFP7_9GAMM|nr:hypothetical protein [Oceanimonas baumannii]OYD22655.1 hypothetical protein B6S09_15565 [Oceanimonas baumannii]TDW57585.1 hypothetical protein LY04_02661 [Oceanimonas baumannii]